MNDEERLRLRLQQIMAGMQNPYQSTPITMESQVEAQLQNLDPAELARVPNWRDTVTRRAARSTAGEQAALKQQMDYANMLRSTPSAQGKRVGPSNIYVENPWEGAEVGLNRALGGYLAGKANQRAARLDETQSGINADITRLKNMETQDQRNFETGLQESKITADTAIATANRANQRAIANQTEAGRNARQAKQVTWLTPDKKVLNSIDLNGVQHGYNDDGTMGGPMRIPPGSMILDTGDAGTVDAAGKLSKFMEQENLTGAKSLQDKQNRFVNLDYLANIPYDDAKLFTGYNPQALASGLGFGARGTEAQQFANMMQYEEAGGLIRAINEADLTPTSDKDVERVAAQFVTAAEQPETIGQFYAYQGRQFLKNQIDHNVYQLQTKTPEEGAAILAAYDKKAAVLALKWGVKPESLKLAGMDEELVDYLVEAQRRARQ